MKFANDKAGTRFSATQPAAFDADRFRLMRAEREDLSGRHASYFWATWKVLAVIYVLGVAVNYLWELGQAHLFTSASHTGNIWIHCFIASLGDGLMILALFWFGWLRLGRRYWFVRPGIYGYALLIAAGASLAVLVEWTAVHVLQRWTYAQDMPRIPWLDIGIVPVFQMMILPLVIFRIAAVLTSLRTSNTQAR